MTLAGCTGCSSLGYLVQAGKGQLAISNRARPLDEVLADERTPPRTRELLKRVAEIKNFGESQGLKPTHNYAEYVQLDRPAATWVVSACEKLRFRPKQWSFPIVGSFTYLGWFDLQDAREHAERLKSEGWDVDVRGASAFSTLGWFRDPVLSSMIGEGPGALGSLVNVVLHESVHATYYVNGQSYLNESLASFIADRLTPEFLANEPGEREAYLRAEKESEARAELMKRAYLKLEALYESQLAEDEKTSQKSAILRDLEKAIGAKREINNATLVQFRTYGIGREEFAALFEACGGDWKRFWASIRKIDEQSFGSKHAEELGPAVLPLARAGC